MKIARLLLLFCSFYCPAIRAQTTYQWTNWVAGAADGSWGSGAIFCRAACRSLYHPPYYNDYFGFRSVLPPGQ